MSERTIITRSPLPALLYHLPLTKSPRICGCTCTLYILPWAGLQRSPIHYCANRSHPQLEGKLLSFDICDSQPKYQSPMCHVSVPSSPSCSSLAARFGVQHLLFACCKVWSETLALHLRGEPCSLLFTCIQRCTCLLIRCILSPRLPLLFFTTPFHHTFCPPLRHLLVVHRTPSQFFGDSILAPRQEAVNWQEKQ